MTTTFPVRLAAALVSFFALTLSAQTALKPPAPAPVDAQTVTLSPFTVSTDRDGGFVATSSLAGGRLASNLADTPAADSVITRECIDSR